MGKGHATREEASRVESVRRLEIGPLLPALVTSMVYSAWVIVSRASRVEMRYGAWLPGSAGLCGVSLVCVVNGTPMTQVARQWLGGVG